jgi:hypothetical protein
MTASTRHPIRPLVKRFVAPPPPGPISTEASSSTWTLTHRRRPAASKLIGVAHLVAAPSGATTVAAYRHRAARLRAKRSVTVVSGGNVDPALLAEQS